MHKVQALASVEFSCAIVFLAETIVGLGLLVWFCFVVLPSEVLGFSVGVLLGILALTQENTVSASSQSLDNYEVSM